MSERTLAEFNKILLENFGFEIDIWPIEKFKGYARNVKKHRSKDIDTMVKAFEETNFKDFIKYDPISDSIADGHRRVAAAIKWGKKELPVLIPRDLTPEKMKLLRLEYNRLPEQSSYDKRNLVNELADLTRSNIDYNFLDYNKYDPLVEANLSNNAEQAFEYPGDSALGSLTFDRPLHEPLQEAEPNQFTPKPSILQAKKQKEDLHGMGLADMIFPSDPIEGIPILSLEYMPKTVKTPFIKHGEVSNKRNLGGAKHFYAFDGKLYNIWHNPFQLLEGNTSQFVEVNFSIRNTHGRAYALGQIFRKRQIAAWLQTKDKEIFVDMNVGGKWRKENLISVPEGYTAYCTRGYTSKAMYIAEQIDLATERAGTNNILFVVYGGGEVIEDCCKEAGCLYFPEVMDVQKGKGV